MKINYDSGELNFRITFDSFLFIFKYGQLKPFAKSFKFLLSLDLISVHLICLESRPILCNANKNNNHSSLWNKLFRP